MYYSNKGASSIIYQKDANGNIMYRTMPDGTSVPIKAGESVPTYETPTEFYNSISGTLTEDEMMAFGNQTKGIAKITYLNDEYPFVPGTLIWKNSTVEYISGVVNEKSADYRVMGVLTTGQHYYRAILEAVVKGEST